MIIDIHTHTFPDKIAASALESLRGRSHTRTFTDGTESGLVLSMQKAGVDYSLILPVATAPGQVMRINDSAIRSARKRADAGLIAFGAMHPDYEDWEAELEKIAEAGMKGIKIHPAYQGVDLDDPRYLRILRRCGDLDLIVLTHTGIDIGLPDAIHCTPEMARHAAEEAGPFKFILGHMGGWREWDRALALLSSLGVWLDTSFSTGALSPLDDGFYQPSDLPMMDECAFLDMVNAFGPDRILFGTDSPWSDQKKSIEWVRALHLPEQEKDMILGENARLLLGL